MRLLGVLLAMTAAGCAQTYPGAWVDEKPEAMDAGVGWSGNQPHSLGLIGFCKEVTPPEAFSRAVVSWDADVGQQDTVRFSLEVCVDGRWLPASVMGSWKGSAGGESRTTPQADSCKVDVDTLLLAEGVKAQQFRYRYEAEGDPRVRFVAVATWAPGDAEPFASVKSAAWGKTIDVPKRSQMVEDEAIRGDICSATSLAMVLEHYGVKKTTREVADGVYDHEAKIYGNWPLNTAYAAIAGMKVAYVAHFRSLADLEAEIAAGRPVIISHRWKEGELTGAPVAASKGHLIVVVGFTETGDVVVNDPAAHTDKGEDVRRNYPRREIYHTWLENASGIAYVIRN